MADIPLINTNLSLPLVQQFAAAGKLIPHDLDGEVHDCSAATALGITVLVGGGATITPTIILADETGVTFSLSRTQVNSLFTSMDDERKSTADFIMTLTESGNSGIAASGSVSMKATAKYSA